MKALMFRHQMTYGNSVTVFYRPLLFYHVRYFGNVIFNYLLTTNELQLLLHIMDSNQTIISISCLYEPLLLMEKIFMLS